MSEETVQQQQKRAELQKIVLGIEKQVETWDSVVTQSTQSLAALCNVSARRIASTEGVGTRSSSTSASTATRVSDIAKLEHYMSQLTRSLELLRDIADKLSKTATMAAECFSKTTDDEFAFTRRTATDPSTIELLEIAMHAAAVHEKEYWRKKSIIEAIDFDRPDLLDVALSSWSSDSSINKTKIKSMLRRSKGFSTS